MDIEKIKTIINSNLLNNIKRNLIISIIAQDKNAIPDILDILNNERAQKNELILDLNIELSRALVILKDENLKYNKKIICDPKWAVEQIKKHYLKWKDTISCSFKIEGLN